PRLRDTSLFERTGCRFGSCGVSVPSDAHHVASASSAVRASAMPPIQMLAAFLTMQFAATEQQIDTTSRSTDEGAQRHPPTTPRRGVPPRTRAAIQVTSKDRQAAELRLPVGGTREGIIRTVARATRLRLPFEQNRHCWMIAN